ncbi:MULTISPECIES: hypothetical protein [Roseobacteraceae]|uniref:hypothetical protein n=1 Tax=Roseobacteraceae TaxID=2854170 RepID=UPI0032ED22A1
MRPKVHSLLRTSRTAAALAVAAVFVPAAAQAYVGPGAGLTAIGTMIALFAGIVLAIIGFVWYPLKRMMKNRSKPTDPAQPTVERSK